MESIHLKTIDPISQNLLQSAAKHGIELSWERYEKAQPQDGFLRLGVACPFDCMRGPCRIDPFGRGPQNGICGMNKDQMAAAMLLKLTQRGVLEAISQSPEPINAGKLTCSESLQSLINERAPGFKPLSLSRDELINSDLLLHHPSDSVTDLLNRSLHLSRLALALVEQSSSLATSGSFEMNIGYGVLSDKQIHVAVSGNPSASLLAEIKGVLEDNSKTKADLISLGDWLTLEDTLIPIATSSGEAELLLGSGAIHMLVAGPYIDPGLVSICKHMKIPIVSDAHQIIPAEIATAVHSCYTHSLQYLDFSGAAIRQSEVITSGETFIERSDAGPERDYALIGGSDNPLLPFGKLSTELMTELSEKGLQIAGWGDSSLWMNRYKPEDFPTQLTTLDNKQGPLLAVTSLAHAGSSERLRGICYTGIKSCLELTMALGLGSLGCRVSVCTPIPILGSQHVCRALSDLLETNGGQLVHFDHPVQAEELVQWF